ncbi:MAG: FAD:protein FMN transferase [Muribaculum sp.]|uniref:FAD:protein FMN transferase n=1 Tax=Candidatus Merdivivens faecigallinarum TaxID=2840871 RepID=A0A9D9J1R5_9BACT|nr:FAD:protein FMN transferase [Candidatus Merdivivens faecigallinarum]
MKNIFAFLAILAITVSCGGNEDYYNIEGYAQGGTYRITLRSDLKKCKELQEGVERILADIDNSISGYNPSSALSMFNGNFNGNNEGPCHASDSGVAGSEAPGNGMSGSGMSGSEVPGRNPILTDIFALSERIYRECGGYFDVSSGALFDAWGFGFKEGTFPDMADIDSIMDFTGMDKIIFRDGRLVKTDPRVTLNFNAIAQGYTCDIIAGYLAGEGITDMLVNVGGEIFCRGVNPSGKEWTIGIDAPIDGNMVAGEKLQTVIEIPVSENGTGVVTSGNYRKFYIKDGKKYSHTVNPKTGLPVEHNLLSATVISDNASAEAILALADGPGITDGTEVTDSTGMADGTGKATDAGIGKCTALADALATYMMVVGVEESIAYVQNHPGIEAVLIYEEDGAIKTWISEGVIVSGEK